MLPLVSCDVTLDLRASCCDGLILLRFIWVKLNSVTRGGFAEHPSITESSLLQRLHVLPSVSLTYPGLHVHANAIVAFCKPLGMAELAGQRTHGILDSLLNLPCEHAVHAVDPRA